MFAVAIDGPAGEPIFGSKIGWEFTCGKFKEGIPANPRLYGRLFGSQI